MVLRTQAYAHWGAQVTAHVLGRLPEAQEHARAARSALADQGRQVRAWTQWCAAVRIR